MFVIFLLTAAVFAAYFVWALQTYLTARKNLKVGKVELKPTLEHSNMNLETPTISEKSPEQLEKEKKEAFKEQDEPTVNSPPSNNLLRQFVSRALLPGVITVVSLFCVAIIVGSMLKSSQDDFMKSRAGSSLGLSAFVLGMFALILVFEILGTLIRGTFNFKSLVTIKPEKCEMKPTKQIMNFEKLIGVQNRQREKEMELFSRIIGEKVTVNTDDRNAQLDFVVGERLKLNIGDFAKIRKETCERFKLGADAPIEKSLIHAHACDGETSNFNDLLEFDRLVTEMAPVSDMVENILTNVAKGKVTKPKGKRSAAFVGALYHALQEIHQFVEVTRRAIAVAQMKWGTEPLDMKDSTEYSKNYQDEIERRNVWLFREGSFDCRSKPTSVKIATIRFILNGVVVIAVMFLFLMKLRASILDSSPAVKPEPKASSRLLLSTFSMAMIGLWLVWSILHCARVTYLIWDRKLGDVVTPTSLYAVWLRFLVQFLLIAPVAFFANSDSGLMPGNSSISPFILRIVTVVGLVTPKLITFMISCIFRRRVPSLKQLFLFPDDSGFFGRYKDPWDIVIGESSQKDDGDTERVKFEGIEQRKKKGDVMSFVYDGNLLSKSGIPEKYFSEGTSRDWFLYGKHDLTHHCAPLLKLSADYRMFSEYKITTRFATIELLQNEITRASSDLSYLERIWCAVVDSQLALRTVFDANEKMIDQGKRLVGKQYIDRAGRISNEMVSLSKLIPAPGVAPDLSKGDDFGFAFRGMFLPAEIALMDDDLVTLAFDNNCMPRIFQSNAHIDRSVNLGGDLAPIQLDPDATNGGGLRCTWKRLKALRALEVTHTSERIGFFEDSRDFLDLLLYVGIMLAQM